MKSLARAFAVIFGIWTLVAACETANNYLLYRLLGAPEPLASLLRRALTDQWIWAALTPIVLLIAREFPLTRRPLVRSAAVHAGCFLALSALHCLLASAVGGPMRYVPPNYQGSLLVLRFLEEFYSDIWMYWPLVCIQALIDSQARTRERDRAATRLESELANARLALLRAQIHPHFLFNTLHSISALIRFDARAAEDMVADLGEILRASFTDLTVQETSLRRELELVRCYLRIQTHRFSDRLRINWQLADGTLEAAVPVLVLQSLVENAVIHGVSPSERPCTVEIWCERRGESLLLRIADDGVGLGGSTPHTGVGLSNARRRLQQLYGTDQSLELAERAGGGVAVTLTLPFRVFESDEAGSETHHEDASADRGRRAAGEAAPVVPVGP
ncbi:MAG TPA: histidine kinase [Steroidobacteraceae bacterium]|nr:histidine kinase [Steroidobacteraceae bacterium]